MNKKNLVCLATGVFFAGTIGIAQAIPLVNVAGDGYEDVGGATYDHYANSGELMSVYGGNNEGHNIGIVEGQIESWLVDNTSLDFIDLSLENTTTDITFHEWDSGSISGTWETDATGDVINFYTVKAGNAYATYLVTPAEGTGSWSTYDLQIAKGHGHELEISHFTSYNPGLNLDELLNPGTPDPGTPDPGTEPIPEPATMLLFGTGMLVLTGTKMRKKKATK